MGFGSPSKIGQKINHSIMGVLSSISKFQHVLVESFFQESSSGKTWKLLACWKETILLLPFWGEISVFFFSVVYIHLLLVFRKGQGDQLFGSISRWQRTGTGILATGVDHPFGPAMHWLVDWTCLGISYSWSAKWGMETSNKVRQQAYVCVTCIFQF